MAREHRRGEPEDSVASEEGEPDYRERPHGVHENLAGSRSHAMAYPEADTNLLQCICKTASEAARKANPRYREALPNEAFELLQYGEYVYVPQAIDVRQGETVFNYGGATTKYKPAHDGYPGASVHYPWAKPQWHAALFNWVHGAGVDFADLASDVGLCMSLLIDTEYTVVPGSFKVCYIFLTIVTIVIEILVAAVDVRIMDGLWLQKIRKRYGQYTWMGAMFKSLVVRYSGCPFQVDNAARLFSNAKGGWNLGISFELPVERERSRAMHDYSRSIGFLTKTPKVVIEDCLLLAMNLFMMHALRTITAGSLISAFFSVYCLVAHLLRTCRFMLSVRRMQRSLRARLSHGDVLRNQEPRAHAQLKDHAIHGSGSDQMQVLLAHPLRRWLAGSVQP